MSVREEMRERGILILAEGKNQGIPEEGDSYVDS